MRRSASCSSSARTRSWRASWTPSFSRPSKRPRRRNDMTKKLLFVTLAFIAGILVAGPTRAETCTGSCFTPEQCAAISTKVDIGPTDDCKPTDTRDQTCCVDKQKCFEDKGGNCDLTCDDNEKNIGVYDCQQTKVCCVQIVTCASQSGTCKAKCATKPKETSTSAYDCTGSKKGCVPPEAPAPGAPPVVEKNPCSVLGGGSCVPKIGCSADTVDAAGDTSDCDTFSEECCVPKPAAPGAPGGTSATGGALPKETKPAELKTVGPYGLKNPLGNRSVPQLVGQHVAWLAALGSNERVEAGRKKIIAAVSGIVVILLAYLIVESLIGVISLKGGS